MRLPIVAGELKDQWWHAASGGKLLRVLTGRYEPEQTALFRSLIAPGSVVLDIGAHVGYYTLLASTLAGPQGHVLAFEPNPRNCGFLRRHVAMNHRSNVAIEEAAVSDVEGTARFDFGTGSGTGHLADGGAIAVRTLRIDDVCAARTLVPTALKIDVEGAELAVLHGAASTIVAHRPIIFLSTHGKTVHRECMNWLDARGYALDPILGNDAAHDTELLCKPREA